MTEQTLEQKAVELLDKLENLTTKYTPEVYDAAVAIIRVDAIGNLLVALIVILFFVFSIVQGLKAATRIKERLSKAHELYRHRIKAVYQVKKRVSNA